MPTNTKQLLDVIKKKKVTANNRIIFFLVLFVSWISLLWLDYLQIFNIPEPLLASGRIIFTILIVMLIISVFLRLTEQRVFKLFDKETDLEQKIFFTKLYVITIYFLGLLVILHSFGLTINNAMLIVGLMATGLAFAVRDVILSFIAWLIILRKHPFRIGDVIRMGEDVGEVLRIGTFFITLDSSNGTVNKVPNKVFLDKSFLNYGKEFADTISIVIDIKKFKKAQDALKTSFPELHYELHAKEDKVLLVVNYRVSPKRRSETRTQLVELLAQFREEKEKKK